MRTSIHDRASLQTIRPLDAIAYLRSNGWTKANQQVEHRFSVWVRKSEAGEEYEVAVPLEHDYRDYPLRVSDALQVLSAFEDRSQVEIFRDLTLVSADVIRVRMIDPELNDGSVAIEEGAEAFPRARDLLLSAACSTVQPRAYFPSRKPGQALDYMRHVRLGQTEHGSFVLTLISRVTPSLGKGDGVLFDPSEDPFERRVTLRLASALAAAKQAAVDAMVNQSIESFVQAVNKGVSANFCDALAGLAKDQEQDRQLEFNFAWSANRQVDSSTIRRIVFSPDTFPTIQEAARQLKETTPTDDYDLLGPVVKLDSDQPEESGKVTVVSLVEGTQKKITFELTGDDYRAAVDAHKDQNLVKCRGVLQREGRRFNLTEIHGFEAVLDD
ncbi:MAG: hypothetical protein AAF802_20415 [Planctomycetota bacterium]